jgi:hypothetical protein
MTGSFLEEPPPVSARVQALYDEDLADGGYVWNVSRLWAHQPDTLKQCSEGPGCRLGTWAVKPVAVGCLVAWLG